MLYLVFIATEHITALIDNISEDIIKILTDMIDD